MSKLLVFLLFFCNWPLYSIIYQLCDMQGVNVGGVGEGGGWFTPQRNYPVCLFGGGGSPLREIIQSVFALRSKLNIFETRDRLRLLSIELEICSNRSNSSEVIC